MLTRIVHNSPQVCAFYDQLHLRLSKPQQQHLLNLTDGLLVCTMVVTVDLRMYLRAKTVRRLNRHRPLGQHILFRSKNSLVCAILEDLRPLLPTGWTIYVQFTSWYASEQLIKYVHHQGWQVTCGLKHNRKLNGHRIDQLASALKHKRYTHVQITAADGNKTRYYVRQTTGRLEKVPFEVRVLFSKRHPREPSPAYFMSPDLTRSAQIRTYGDLIRRHRDEHAVAWLTGALEMMQETGDIQQVLHRNLRLEATST